MSYEPGTSECRVLIDSKSQIESILRNLARLDNTAAIREQLVGVYNELEQLHDQRREQRRSQQPAALL